MTLRIVIRTPSPEAAGGVYIRPAAALYGAVAPFIRAGVRLHRATPGPCVPWCLPLRRRSWKWIPCLAGRPHTRLAAPDLVQRRLPMVVSGFGYQPRC